MNVTLPGSILMVDDHPPNLVALEAVLAPLGHRLVRAASGADALRQILLEDFAVILLDVAMPDLDGFQTAHLIKTRERSRYIPILFLSAMNREEAHILKGYAHGAVDYLIKPYDPDVLRSKVAFFMSLHARSAELAVEAREGRSRDVQRGEAAFRRIMGTSLFGLIFTDDDGRVMEANDAFLEMVGYTQQDVAEHRVRWDELTPPEFAPQTRAALKELHERGVASAFEKEYLRRDGTRIQVLVGSTRVEEQERNITFVLDISARKRAERERAELFERERLARAEAEAQRRHLHQLLMDAPAAVAILRGPELVYELANPLYVRLVGRESSELLGQPGRVALPELTAQGIWDGFDRVYATGEAFTGKEMPVQINRREDGTLDLGFFNFTAQGTRDAHGRVDGVLLLAVEVTEQVRARKAAEEAAEELERSLQLRETFLSVASHELKTPITSLHLQLKVLERVLPASEQPRVRIVERQVNRLSSLVDGLLDVSRISAGKLHVQLEPCDLVALLSDLVARLTPQAEASGCTLRLMAPDTLTGQWDVLRVEQVVSNLLTNAIKYGAGRPIEVTVAPEGDRVRVAVKDRGIGIEPEHMTRIFGRFERAVSERHYGGLGLGLFISRSIVDALGGSLEVESRSGEGSTFTVWLPRGGGA